MARDHRISMEDAVDSAVRRGLAVEPDRERYRLATRPMGLRSGIDLERALRLAGELDDAEAIRKRERGP